MILDKAKMAHEYAMKHVQEGFDINYDVLVVEAWKYADAMQAEANKRVVKFPDVFFETKPNEEWQPDWSKANEGFNWWAIDKCGDAYFYNYEPYINISGEYWADSNLMHEKGMSDESESFNYIGKWQDSLRKRP